MAKKRRRKTGKMPAALARYWAKKHKEGARPVAKRKRRRKSSSRRSSRSIVVARKSPARRRRHHSGGHRSSGLMPGTAEMLELGATALYGFLESKAKADPKFLLNEIPQPIVGLGYAGNIALILRVANGMFVKNKWLGLMASGAAHAAMYQLGKRGSLATDTNISGGYLGEDYLEGLAAEGEGLSGTEWDSDVMPGT